MLPVLIPTKTMLPTLIPVETDKAFMAACLETDGCITLNFVLTSCRAKICVANKSLVLLYHLQRLWGGAIRHNGGRIDCYQLDWSNSKRIVEILKPVFPYLISKRREAELLLEYCSSIPYNEIGSPLKGLLSSTRKEEILFEMKILHHGGRK
jgi:hypothetical protein